VQLCFIVDVSVVNICFLECLSVSGTCFLGDFLLEAAFLTWGVQIALPLRISSELALHLLFSVATSIAIFMSF